MTKKINLTGRVFGRWHVVGPADTLPSGQTAWVCRCDCGVVKSVVSVVLRDGRSKSCGCLKSSLTVERSTKHGHAADGALTPTYHSWVGMIQRCTNPNNSHWAGYGGRGITVCPHWMTFAHFLADMGEKPPKTSIDRIDNDKGYAPENCRWAVTTTQARNKRNNAVLTHAGKTATMAEWAEQLGIHPATLSDRLQRGWSVDRALTSSAKGR